MRLSRSSTQKPTREVPGTSVLYVLPKRGFFAEGPGGRVTHAVGVALGVAANGLEVYVVSGVGTIATFAAYAQEIRPLEVTVASREPLGSLRWTEKLVRYVGDLLQHDGTIGTVLIRYSVSNAMRFVPLMKRFPERKWLFEVNSLAFHQLHFVPWPIRRSYMFVEQWILKQASHVYVVSEQLKDDITRGSFGVPEEQVIVIPNGGPEPLFHEIRTGTSNTPLRYVYLGVFHEYYELPLVLGAFADVKAADPRVELHLYGDGPMREHLERLATGMRGVFFHGRFELRTLLRAGEITCNDILLLPYAPMKEAFQSPIKLYEYMALGLPIVASAVGQIARVLENDYTAKLYKAGSRRSLAEAMLSLAQNHDLRNILMERVREGYPEAYTWRGRMSQLVSHLA